MRGSTRGVFGPPATSWTLVALVTLGLAACRGETESGAAGPAGGGGRAPAPAAPAPAFSARLVEAPAAPAVERGTAAADPVPAGARAPEAPGRPARRPAVRGFEVSRVDAPRGEDGDGAVVPATDPVALDVLADAWPGRALDPVLHAGTLRFLHYSHPRPGVLRFVAADSTALPDGVEVFVQYGDEQASRMLVTPSLRVPR